MRSQSKLRCVAIFACVLSASAVGWANQPHSWCTTGGALIKNDSGSDVDTNAIIAAVCGDPNYASCCSDAAGTQRWGLACVQKAADTARAQNRLGGDYCGRYAWAQGRVGTTDQYYPRDFNLVAVSGGVNSVRDVEGAVAAKGSVSFANFHLSNNRREEIALLSAGNVSLYNGTVNGKVQYGGSFAATGVTFVEATRPTAATNPSLINFDSLKASMITLSQSLRDRYTTNGTAVKQYSTLTFTGTDPELNVFTVDASQLMNTTTFSFAVPAGSGAIITVTGTAPAFKYAGFSGTLPVASKTMWNFPDATTLTLNGIGFSGSILAPKAAANFNNGNIRGTVVVGSGTPAYVELYAAPFQLGCSGGLCLDKTWSCSSDTTMADNGTAADLASEAGFMEIEGGSYRNEGYDRVSPTHRVWYSFHPAQFARKNKPLAVFFNGGPGAGTTPFLFAFNTGPYTVDPQLTSGIANNPNTWTKFANLLYIDAPATGFSYPLKDTDGTQRDIGNDMDRDASNFLRVLARFLVRHPALVNNQVVIVGESYGGVRATLMLHHLYNYAALTQDHVTEGFKDTQLSSELANYFGVALATTTPGVTDLLTRFGHQVLIEPAVAGQEQRNAFWTVTNPSSPPYLQHFNVNPLFPMAGCKPQFADDPMPCWTTRSADPTYGVTERQPTCDSYNCDRDKDWSSNLEDQAGTKLTALGTLNVALGVNAKTIAWMNDQTRNDRAYGRASNGSGYVQAVTPVNLNSAANFGELNADDNYLVVQNGRVSTAYGWVPQPVPPGTPPAARGWASPGVGSYQGSAFATLVRNGVKTFITVASYDAAIWSPSITYGLYNLALNGQLGTVQAAGFDATFHNIVSDNNNGIRPGAMEIWWDSYPDGYTQFVTMPTYNSGHTVPMRAPADLLTDVGIWYTH